MTLWRVVLVNVDPEQDWLEIRRVYRVGAETALDAYDRAYLEWRKTAPQTVNGFTATVERDEALVLPAPGRAKA